MSQKSPYVKGTLASKTRFSLEVNGVLVVLNQTTLGGRLCWAGRPYSKSTGRVCPVSLIIADDGTMPYGPALNFLVDGGKAGQWASRDKERLDTIRKQVLLGWQFHVSQSCSEEVRASQLAEIGTDLGEWLSSRGFAVVDSKATQEDHDMYALLGIPYEIVNLSEHHGWTLVPNLPAIVGTRVPPKYAEVGEGAWDTDSDVIASTNQLTAGEVEAMKRSNLCFVRCSALKKAQ